MEKTLGVWGWLNYEKIQYLISDWSALIYYLTQSNENDEIDSAKCKINNWNLLEYSRVQLSTHVKNKLIMSQLGNRLETMSLHSDITCS